MSSTYTKTYVQVSPLRLEKRQESVRQDVKPYRTEFDGEQLMPAQAGLGEPMHCLMHLLDNLLKIQITSWRRHVHWPLE